MSRGNLADLMNRLKDTDTPLAVFSTAMPGWFDICFADTLHTRKLIEQGHANLIGVYDSTSKPEQIRREVRGCRGHTYHAKSIYRETA